MSGITHAFSSGKAAASDSTLVDGPKWNAAHVITEYVDVPANSSPGSPAASYVRVFGRDVAGRILLATQDPSGLNTSLQPFIGRNRVCCVRPNGNGTTLSAFGYTLSATGTATAANVSTSTLHTQLARLDYLVTTAATTAVAGFRSASGAQFWRGNEAGRGGFLHIARWAPATGVTTATERAWCGLLTSSAAPTDVNPSTLVNAIGMGWDSSDSNVQLMYNDGTGTASKIDLGSSFVVPSADRPNPYELVLFCPPNGTYIKWAVIDLATGTTASGTLTTDIPSNTTLLCPMGYCSVGGTSSVVGITLFSLYTETDN